ncbi:hypothetical protein CIK76_04325 [Glutamicibacter sp. BW80]|nr:hypothetical protein CIK76_04325 [Glutamicibacter sp. BW80]
MIGTSPAIAGEKSGKSWEAQIGTTAPLTADLSDYDNVTVTPEEERAFIEQSAKEFAELDATGGVTLPDGSFYRMDVDQLVQKLAMAEDGLSVSSSQIAAGGQIGRAAVSWDWNSFGSCVAKEMGIKAAVELAKVFAEPKVRKALKSKQWRKASSIAYERLKKISPKVAKLIIKKAANSVLPGGIVTVIAIPVGKCAIKELF